MYLACLQEPTALGSVTVVVVVVVVIVVLVVIAVIVGVVLIVVIVIIAFFGDTFPNPFRLVMNIF